MPPAEARHGNCFNFPTPLQNLLGSPLPIHAHFICRCSAWTRHDRDGARSHARFLHICALPSRRPGTHQPSALLHTLHHALLRACFCPSRRCRSLSLHPPGKVYSASLLVLSHARSVAHSALTPPP